MGLIDETHYEDQGLSHVAFYPTQAASLRCYIVLDCNMFTGLANNLITLNTTRTQIRAESERCLSRLTIH